MTALSPSDWLQVVHSTADPTTEPTEAPPLSTDDTSTKRALERYGNRGARDPVRLPVHACADLPGQPRRCERDDRALPGGSAQQCKLRRVGGQWGATAVHSITGVTTNPVTAAATTLAAAPPPPFAPDMDWEQLAASFGSSCRVSAAHVSQWTAATSRAGAEATGGVPPARRRRRRPDRTTPSDATTTTTTASGGGGSSGDDDDDDDGDAYDSDDAVDAWGVPRLKERRLRSGRLFFRRDPVLDVALLEPYRLYAHQVAAVRLAVRAERAAYRGIRGSLQWSHAAGSGQSLVALATAVVTKTPQTLIVCSLSALDSWLRDTVHRFFGDRFRVLIWRRDVVGDTLWQTLTEAQLATFHVVLTNYETVVAAARDAGLLTSDSAQQQQRSAHLVAGGGVGPSESWASPPPPPAAVGLRLLLAREWPRVVADDVHKWATSASGGGDSSVYVALTHLRARVRMALLTTDPAQASLPGSGAHALPHAGSLTLWRVWRWLGYRDTPESCDWSAARHAEHELEARCAYRRHETLCELVAAHADGSAASVELVNDDGGVHPTGGRTAAAAAATTTVVAVRSGPTLPVLRQRVLTTVELDDRTRRLLTVVLRPLLAALLLATDPPAPPASRRLGALALRALCSAAVLLRASAPAAAASVTHHQHTNGGGGDPLLLLGGDEVTGVGGDLWSSVAPWVGGGFEALQTRVAVDGWLAAEPVAAAAAAMGGGADSAAVVVPVPPPVAARPPPTSDEVHAWLCEWDRWLADDSGTAGRRSPKLDSLVALLHTSIPCEQQVVVLADHEPLLRLAYERVVAEWGVGSAVVVTTAVPRAERDRRINAFRQRRHHGVADCRVALVSYAVAGWNLVEAAHVVQLEWRWQSADRQALGTGRVWRLGQQHREVIEWGLVSREEVELRRVLATVCGGGANTTDCRI